MFTKEDLIAYLKEHYPNTDNTILYKRLGLSHSALRTLASRNGIRKSKEYLVQQHKSLMEAKERAYLSSIPNIELSSSEKNIIIGSILGDGSLSFSQRSRNAYYREHFSIKQKEYRQWKMNNIHSLNFRIEKDTHLKSPSHPIFTDLYKQFYINGRKTITENNIKPLKHPIGLMCLYLDDGTLMINVQKKNNNIYITPSVGLSTLCFTKTECRMLKEHFITTFGIEFRISPHPAGLGSTMVCSKLDYVEKFFRLIYPYCQEIQSMRYKWDVEYRVQSKYRQLTRQYPNGYNIRISSMRGIPPRYSPEEEKTIIRMKRHGNTDKEIANALDRPYWGIVDKIRRMKKLDLLD